MVKIESWITVNNFRKCLRGAIPLFWVGLSSFNFSVYSTFRIFEENLQNFLSRPGMSVKSRPLYRFLVRSIWAVPKSKSI